MRYNNKYEESLSCANKNILLFVMYIRGELSRERELRLDNHIINCDDCKAGFTMVEEILNLSHPLSANEKTLFLKNTTDPLWHQSFNTLKQQLITELKESVEKEILNLSVNLLTDNKAKKRETTLTTLINIFDKKIHPPVRTYLTSISKPFKYFLEKLMP